MAERNSSRPDDRAIGREIVERAIGAPLDEKPRGKSARGTRNHPDRAFNLWLGPVFFAFGALSLGLIVLGVIVMGELAGSFLILLFLISVFLGITLVGLNMLIQGRRNRPGSEGFFYRWL